MIQRSRCPWGFAVVAILFAICTACTEVPRQPADAAFDAPIGDRAVGPTDGTIPADITGLLPDASIGEQGLPLGNRIQVQVTFECRAGGVQFIATPTTPFAGPNGYRFVWERASGTARLEATENRVVAFNSETGDQIHLNLHVFREGYPEAIFNDIWSFACPTGADLLVCPLNDRRVETNQESYALGDRFEAELLGARQDVGWFNITGLDGVVENRAAHTLMGRVSGFPIRVQGQIWSDGNIRPRPCGGWTTRFFTAPQSTPTPDAGVAVDVPDLQPPPISDRIQAQVMQECREGGVKFTVVPTSPYRQLGGYTFRWNLTQGSAPYVVSNNSVVVANTNAAQNWPGYPMHFAVTISHRNYPDAVLTDVWSNPCNHDDNPLDCPENTREIVTDQETYAPGDRFVARYPGAGALTLSNPWYGLDGLRDPPVYADEQRTIMAIVDRLPIRVHAQINSPQVMGGPRICHGWTERYFFGR